MSETRFTPGPWRTYKNEGRQIVATTSSWAYSAVGLVPEDKEAEVANARLIAAAPQMHDALQSLLKEWSDVLPVPVGCSTEGDVEAGRGLALKKRMTAARELSAKSVAGLECIAS